MIVGAVTLGLFLPLFVWVMNNTQKTSGSDLGLMWFWAILLIVVFLAIMGAWHSVFAPQEDKQSPPPH
jgi:hypothetical protein